MDNDRSGASLGLPVLLALCGALLENSLKGGLIVIGALNLGGSVEPLAKRRRGRGGRRGEGRHDGVDPVYARRQLFDLSDDMATRVNVQFYSDAPDALLKARLE